MPDITIPCTSGRHEGNDLEQRRIPSKVFYIVRIEAGLISELTIHNICKQIKVSPLHCGHQCIRVRYLHELSLSVRRWNLEGKV